MIDINLLRKSPDHIRKSAQSKNVDVPVDEILTLDNENRKYVSKISFMRSELRTLSKKKPDQNTITKLRHLSDEIQHQERLQKTVQEKLLQKLYDIPAIPQPDVRIGKDETENEILRVVGNPTKFSYTPKDYMQLSEALDLIDTTRAAKVSGTRFGYIKNELVLLELALIHYTFEKLVYKKSFTPFFPPVLILKKAMNAMGYLQHGGEDDTYHLQKDNLYLVGTAEQSLGPYHMDEIIDEDKLPLRYCAFSTCFRREAGAAGKDTTGILRVHQFDKIEMFIFCKPEHSDEEHENLLRIEEELVSDLQIPYQVIKMCTGDLGMPTTRKYDIECWMPSQNKYRETHSTSHCADYQARRLNIRFKDKKTTMNYFLHTLNGTAFALGRMLIMIVENYQQKDGSIKIPKALQKYMNGLTVIKS